jgi:hypothetical protein
MSSSSAFPVCHLRFLHPASAAIRGDSARRILSSNGWGLLSRSQKDIRRDNSFALPAWAPIRNFSVGPCQGVRHLKLEIGNFKLFFDGSWQGMSSMKVVPSQTSIPRPWFRQAQGRALLRESQTRRGLLERWISVTVSNRRRSTER